MDVHEDKEKNLVTATFELPGINKQDVTIDIHNNHLTVSGETKFESDRDENGFVVRERRFGRFSRTLPVPEGVKVCTPSVPPSRFEQNTDGILYIARGDQGCDGEWGPDCVLPSSDSRAAPQEDHYRVSDSSYRSPHLSLPL